MFVHSHRGALTSSRRISVPAARGSTRRLVEGGVDLLTSTQRDHDAVPLGLFQAVADKLGEETAEKVQKLFEQSTSPHRVIIRDFTVRLLAISNKDGRRTYIDRRIPDWLFVVKQGGGIMAMSPDQPLNEHEEVEWVCMEKGGMTYAQAHRVALVAEQLVVENMGFLWHSYDGVMQDLIRLCAEAPDDNPPPDPYLTWHQANGNLA